MYIKACSIPSRYPYGVHRFICSETGFRNNMLTSVRVFSSSRKNGLFLNSCFAHCQSERQDTWFADDSPIINNKVRRFSFWSSLPGVNVSCGS